MATEKKGDGEKKSSGGSGAAPKSKLVAALLAIFLGTLGIHNFYLGHKQKGIIQLVLCLLCVTMIIPRIWSIIEFVQILMGSIKDSDGNDLV